VSRAYRRQTVRAGIAAIWALPALFLVRFAVDGSVPSGQRIAYAAIAAVFALLAVRTWRIGVFTRPDGVVVRGVLRSWRLPWDGIARFEWGIWRGWGSFPCGVVRRDDGSQITVLALNPPFELQPGQNRRVPEMLAALNEELARARGWAEPPPSEAPGDPASPPPHPAPPG
jgi:hypothetical protein